MKLSCSQILQNSFVITIDKQRLLTMHKLFRRNGLSPSPNVIFGCIDSRLSHVQRCAQSHVNAVQHAKQIDLPFVVVFEDDAYPCIDCAAKLQKCFVNMPDNAQLILLGWSSFPNGTQSTYRPFNRIQTWKISGAHAYVLMKQSYDVWLSFFRRNPYATADNMIFQSVPNSYILDKPLFIQYSQKCSMNRHSGYIYFGDHRLPPPGFKRIEDVLS